jgi:hypothetical protein
LVWDMIPTSGLPLRRANAMGHRDFEDAEC